MESEGWVFRVEVHKGESLGHFLGRFRRANQLSHKALAEHLGIRVEWVQAWEMPSRRRNPTPLQLIALSKLTDVELKQLAKMLPPEPLHLKTRLCAACYAKTPVHLQTWQRLKTGRCDRHFLRLLSACPVCNSGFRTPALWEDECCEHCGLAFSQMQSYQQPSQWRSPLPSPNPKELGSGQ
jgi:transcriptional regulator with XRE-family HTH domain